MAHVLDNPTWNALISNNRHLGGGNDHVKYFDADVSPFVALRENTEENFRELYNVIPAERSVLFMTAGTTTIPDFWKAIATIPGYQMVHTGGTPEPNNLVAVKDLTAEHIPQMLALTKLTNPGPFAQRTIEFGHYKGVFSEEKLVAMTGQRMHAGNYMEVSAVCTHPDHLGKGYARQLLLHHIIRIKAEGGTPYLHVRDDNARAIKVYEDMGFVTRIPVTFYFMRKRV
ncbi:GNAT family N-acetyltransferase [Mucilaginibacter terrenus]|uniref:GNAT family N-acetyltransferase n=1 Tax=Mucilaginibacter terrenus TaxID=2482727 RepID=A0A3E2NK91_9SPHI|nr:GNAT family N-acetyltransferase [Mucilaginibacter terrenus]RFZ81361.1 GNAT family N-acetyltransferase [Mucilaginibacter terrenus]